MFILIKQLVGISCFVIRVVIYFAFCAVQNCNDELEGIKSLVFFVVAILLNHIVEIWTKN